MGDDMDSETRAAVIRKAYRRGDPLDTITSAHSVDAGDIFDAIADEPSDELARARSVGSRAVKAMRALWNNVAMITRLDDAGIPHSLQIALPWSGGEITSDNQRTVFTSPLSRTMVNSSGSIRNSTLLSGTLVFDGVNLMDTSIPVQSRFTTQFLVSAKGSSIDIVRTR